MNTIRSAAVLVVLALLAAACSGGDDDAAPVNTVAPVEDTTSTTSTSTTTTTTTTSTTTTTTTTTTTVAPEGTDEEQIEALIEAYWRTVADVFNPPKPDVALWEAVASEGLSISLAENAEEALAAGQGIEISVDGDLVASSMITVIEGFAIVFACLRDTGRTYEIASGNTVEQSAVVSLKRMEAQLTENGWRVSSSENLDRFEQDEEEACAAAFP